MKKVIGVTGGVGAGKSTVLNILKEEHQADIILADEVAHTLMKPGQECYKQIVQAFGEEILADDGKLDKAKVSELIFNDADKKSQMDGIVHPAVRVEIEKLVANSSSELVVIEAALLVESGYRDICDEYWYVYVSTQERVKRLYEQRGYSEFKSYSIIFNQLTPEEFERNCDVVIDNGGTIEETRAQVQEFLQKLAKK
jgi:dephospho-CoA kinase